MISTQPLQTFLLDEEFCGCRNISGAGFVCTQGDIRNKATEINRNIQVIHMFSFSLHSESKVKKKLSSLKKNSLALGDGSLGKAFLLVRLRGVFQMHAIRIKRVAHICNPRAPISGHQWWR